MTDMDRHADVPRPYLSAAVKARKARRAKKKRCMVYLGMFDCFHEIV
jgi:hypothetical protein